MTPPDDTPPWLTKAGELFEVSDALHGLIGETQGWERGDLAVKPRAWWESWRSRVAAALGLVVPSDDIEEKADVAVKKCIATELRRLADRMEAAGERFDKICRYEVVDGILRHRANELDPP